MDNETTEHEDVCPHCGGTGTVRYFIDRWTCAESDCPNDCEPCEPEKESDADDELDAEDRYWSGTGESMDDESYTDYLNGGGSGWMG